jgi:hypothetical protein
MMQPGRVLSDSWQRLRTWAAVWASAATAVLRELVLEGLPIGEHVEPPETHSWAGVRFGRSAMTVSRIAC